MNKWNRKLMVGISVVGVVFGMGTQRVEAAIGDIGHWKDTVGGQIPNTTFAAFEFDSEIRNDGIYTKPDNGTIEFSEAGHYLIIATIRGVDDSNGRYNAQARIAQTAGTGSLFTSYYTGYSRDNSEDTAWFRAVGVVLDASANTRVQVQRRRDTDAPTSGSVANESDVQVVRINPANWGLYALGASSGGVGGTTPNTMDITSVIAESSTSSIEGNISTETITIKGSNKRYLVVWSVSGDTGGSRTQRVGHLEYDGSDDLSTSAYCYQRSSTTEYCGLGSMDLVETTGSNKAIKVEVYRGAGVSADQGGADDDGSFTLDGNGQIIVLELPDSVEVFKSRDNTGLQNITSAVNLNAIRNVDFGDTGSFVKNSNSQVEVVSAADVMVWANIWTARNNVGSGSRLTAYGSITINGVKQSVGEHGNYTRGNQASTDTFAGSFHPAGIFAISSDGDLIGVDMDSLAGTEGGGNDRTQAGTVGLLAINLNTWTSIVSITLTTDGSVNFGGMALDQVVDTTALGINDIETVSVLSGPVNLDVRSTSFTDGGNSWSYGVSSGNDQCVWEFSPNGSSWTIVEVADTLYSLASNVANGGEQDLYLRLTTPITTTTFGDYDTVLTIVASAP